MLPFTLPQTFTSYLFTSIHHFTLRLRVYSATIPKWYIRKCFIPNGHSKAEHKCMKYAIHTSINEWGSCKLSDRELMFGYACEKRAMRVQKSCLWIRGSHYDQDFGNHKRGNIWEHIYIPVW